jgi:signal transduction histidine kinase/CheY-like chemotaxis protein
MHNPGQRDTHVLLLMPTGRDAEMTAAYLGEAGIQVDPCISIDELCNKVLDGKGGAVLLAEEALMPNSMQCLLRALSNQPPWSDFPLVVLTAGGGAAPRNLPILQALSEAGNVTLIERPTRVITLVSAIQSALRSRRRQYQMRDLLVNEKKASEERALLFKEATAAREEAEAINRAKDVFLATLSHELRTPLTAVLGWVRVLRGVKMDEQIARHALEVIERNARSQHQLIQDLLEVSRIITGKLRLDVRPIRLESVVNAAIDSVRPAVDAKAIRLDLKVDPNANHVKGDPDRLQQVIWNLLSNAAKFAPKNGQIGVEVSRHGSEARITVSDNGQGIPAEFLPFVFDRFRQIDGSTTRTHGGLGLGLAVVRHLVEQHGGTVSAQSDGDGQGAVFTINLPVLAVCIEHCGETKTDRSANGAGFEHAYNLAGIRVLVVDDQVDALELISVVLRYAGAEVFTADSAASALQLVKETEPDILVSDIGMPVKDGVSLISELRARAGTPGRNLRAVALSAYAADEDRDRSIAAGFDCHLTKPVEPDVLIATVARLAEPAA